MYIHTYYYSFDLYCVYRLLNEIFFGANINTKDLNQVTHALAANPYGADKIWDFLDTYWSNVPNRWVLVRVLCFCFLL